MAVTQNSDGNSKQQVKEGVEPSCREDADVGPFGLAKKSDGNPSRCSEGTFFQKERYRSGQRVINNDTRGMVKSCKLRRKRNKDNESDSLSDIDDAEVCGYLNSKEQIHYKRILWEAMNGNYTKAKKQKRDTKTKEGVSVNKAAKATKKVEVQKPSSRINYDALKLLNDESEPGSENAQIIRVNSVHHRTENSSNGNISNEMHGSNESSYNEHQHDINYREDNQAFGDHDGEIYYNNNGDEHFDVEDFDF